MKCVTTAEDRTTTNKHLPALTRFFIPLRGAKKKGLEREKEDNFIINGYNNF